MLGPPFPMVSVNALDFALVVIFGTIIVTALIARWTGLPITALEILAGILLIIAFDFELPIGTGAILNLGSLLIVFLAGLETNFDFLRKNLYRAVAIGLPSFLVPFVGLFVLLAVGLQAPLLVSIVGATALADVSISVVYTTLQQYDLTDLPFGRLILASTLAVNLVEDFTITTTTFLTTTGVLFALGVLGALALAALTLPYIGRVADRGPAAGAFTNLPARTLLFSLAILAFLSALVGVPGILFVFLMGLFASQWATAGYLADIRKLGFALFIPLYFLAVGLRVEPGYIAAHWPVVLAVVGAASALRLFTLYPIARRVFGTSRAGPVAVLMNARLTSATVILVLALSLGMITTGWYSLFIAVVVILALASAGAVRAFPAFGSPQKARALFGAGAPAPGGTEPLPVPLPTSMSWQR